MTNPEESVAFTNQPVETSNKSSSFLDKLKDMSKRQKAFSAVILILVILGVLAALIFFIMRKDSLSSSSEEGFEDGRLQNYLVLELKYYPANPSDEAITMLKQKIMNDEITLKYGKEQGLIEGTYELNSPSANQYLERTKAVAKVKEAINKKADHIEVEVVSIWFYNNGEIGPLGYEKGKEMAFRKINEYYNKVKKKEMTIKQVGEAIALDEELIKSRMNISLKENAYIVLKGEKGRQMSFWPEFDAVLWQMKAGDLTEIFTGTDTDKDGKVIPVLYAIGQIKEKVSEGSDMNYDQWLKDSKK